MTHPPPPPGAGPGRGAAPAASARWPLALALLAGLALALHAGWVVPLWELPGEHAQLRLVDRVARGLPPLVLGDAPPDTPREAAQPPPASWLHGAAARALGLHRVRFAPRPAPPGSEPAAARWLHGADELPPFAGPARAAHALRLVSVVPALLTALLAAALARRLEPGSGARHAAPLAAALLLVAPFFVTASATAGPGTLAAAAGALAALVLARLFADAEPSRGRCLRAGLAVGLAQWTSLAAVPLVPVALACAWWHPHRPEGRRSARLRVDALLAGTLLAAGPLWTWSLLRYGAPLPPPAFASLPSSDASLLSASVSRWLPALGAELSRRLSLGVLAGPAAGWVWAACAAAAALGWPVALRRADPPRRRIAAMLAALVAAGIGGSWLLFALRGETSAAPLLPALPALAALLAAGLAGLLRRAAPLAVLALLLAALTAHAQLGRLAPAYRPLQRVDDPHFVCFDPLAEVPAVRRLPTLRLLEPADRSVHREPPRVAWAGPADPAARYTVQLWTPGLAASWGSYETAGIALRDGWRIPAHLWKGLPPGIDLVCRVVQLPTREEALAAPPGALDVRETLPAAVRRAPD